MTTSPKKIPDLPAASSVPDDALVIMEVSGDTKKVTIAQLKSTFVSEGGGGSGATIILQAGIGGAATAPAVPADAGGVFPGGSNGTPRNYKVTATGRFQAGAGLGVGKTVKLYFSGSTAQGNITPLLTFDANTTDDFKTGAAYLTFNDGEADPQMAWVTDAVSGAYTVTADLLVEDLGAPSP